MTYDGRAAIEAHGENVRHFAAMARARGDHDAAVRLESAYAELLLALLDAAVVGLELAIEKEPDVDGKPGDLICTGWRLATRH